MSGPGRPPDSMGGSTVPIGDVVTRRSRHPVSREGEVRNLGQEEPHAVTYASVQELMEAVLESGERRVSFAAVMRALAKGESEQVAVVLTEDRLLVASVAWPSDYELTEALDRDDRVAAFLYRAWQDERRVDRAHLGVNRDRFRSSG